MGLRLTPRDTTFFDLFARNAAVLVAGSRQLTTLLGAVPGERAEAALQLRELEQQLDEGTHEIIRRVCATFVTPFGRGEIHALAAALDDCLDRMSAAGDLIEVLNVVELPKGVCKQVEVIDRMAELTHRVMAGLGDMRGLHEYSVEINRLENEANRHYRQLLARLLERDPAEALTVLRIKVIVDELEHAADAFERVAYVLEGIALKES